jgi:hypothetical protein
MPEHALFSTAAHRGGDVDGVEASVPVKMCLMRKMAAQEAPERKRGALPLAFAVAGPRLPLSVVFSTKPQCPALVWIPIPFPLGFSAAAAAAVVVVAVVVAADIAAETNFLYAAEHEQCPLVPESSFQSVRRVSAVADE